MIIPVILYTFWAESPNDDKDGDCDGDDDGGNEDGGDGDVLETGYSLELSGTNHNFTLSFSIRELSSARLVGETFSKR